MISKKRMLGILAAPVLFASAATATAAPIVVTPGRAAGYMYFPKASTGGGAGGAGSTNFFLKIVYSGTNTTIKVSPPISPKVAPATWSSGNYNYPSGSGSYNGVYTAAGALMPDPQDAVNPQNAMANNPSVIATLSSDLKLTVSIQETLPPTNAPVHFPGTKQPANTNVGRTVYIAGVPNKVNLKPIDGATAITLTLGGAEVVLSALTLPTGALIVPSILLPDLTLIADGSPTVPPAGYPVGYSPVAGTRYAASVATTVSQSPYEASIGNYYTSTSQYFQPNPPYGNYTIPSQGFIGLSGQGTVAVNYGANPCNNVGPLIFDEGLTIQSSVSGGLYYSLTKGANYQQATSPGGAPCSFPNGSRVISEGKIGYILTY